MSKAQEQVTKPTTSAWLRRVRIFIRITLIGGIAIVLLSLLLPIPWQRNEYRHDMKAAIEITQLSQALTTFATMYGEYPASSIIIYEQAAMRRKDAPSAQKIRQLWPPFNFEQNLDLNSDGDTEDVHELSGAECLVFFLGGMRVSSREPNGFSKNPVFPFNHEGSNRVGPFMVFDIDRLTDVDADGFNEYGDPLGGTPYLYASRWTGQYRNQDLAIYPVGDARNMAQVYERGPQAIGDYQIISAGSDGKYGVGGTYWGDGEMFHGNRSAERDNITNFSNGRLDQF